MLTVSGSITRIARRLGGPRFLALPLLRILAVFLSLVWVTLTFDNSPGRHSIEIAVAAFSAYCAILIGALWVRPAPTLRLNVVVLVVDVTFALVLIRLSGGAPSALYLALLLIAGLQSYYYGLRRGLYVGAASSVGYVVVVWPTLEGIEWANVTVRIVTLLGTALLVGILADVEEGERLQVFALTSAAQERERFIRSVVEGLREGVVALDSAGGIVAWNEAMARCSGLRGADVLGRDFFVIFGGPGPASWMAPLRRLLRGELEEFAVDEVEHPVEGRGRVVLNFRASRLRHGDAGAGAVLLIQDVTERVGFEQAARQAEKLAAVGTLAAGIAHELNNPIGIISSRIELMLLDAGSRPLPEGTRRDLDVLHRHAQRVARIAQGLLTFARQAPHELGAVDLNRVVEDSLLLMDKSFAKSGVALARRLAPGLPPLLGDANALQQVVINLLSNARDAIEGRGEIFVETCGADDPSGGVRLMVRDTGHGIAPDALQRIFDPFFTTKAQGTGLGLSITYGIVRDHRGTVDVESTPGRGTTFTLTFPAAPAEARV
ncbi:MAG: two-component system sensor histidine kinase NtrB [Candidatus Rokuibacteriota bacterium]